MLKHRLGRRLYMAGCTLMLLLGVQQYAQACDIECCCGWFSCSSYCSVADCDTGNKCRCDCSCTACSCGCIPI
jgi:hypothetical protein